METIAKGSRNATFVGAQGPAGRTTCIDNIMVGGIVVG